MRNSNIFGNPLQEKIALSVVPLFELEWNELLQAVKWNRVGVSGCVCLEGGGAGPTADSILLHHMVRTELDLCCMNITDEQQFYMYIFQSFFESKFFIKHKLMTTKSIIFKRSYDWFGNSYFIWVNALITFKKEYLMVEFMHCIDAFVFQHYWVQYDTHRSFESHWQNIEFIHFARSFTNLKSSQSIREKRVNLCLCIIKHLCINLFVCYHVDNFAFHCPWNIDWWSALNSNKLLANLLSENQVDMRPPFLEIYPLPRKTAKS